MAKQELNEEMLSTLLEMDIENLADKPEFPRLTTGTHLLTFRSTEFAANKHGYPMVTFVFTYDALLESEEADAAAPVEEGSEFKFIFNLFKEDGTPQAFAQGEMKLISVALAKAAGVSKIGELNEAAANMQVEITARAAVSKKDPTQINSNIVAVKVAGGDEGSNAETSAAI